MFQHFLSAAQPCLKELHEIFLLFKYLWNSNQVRWTQIPTPLLKIFLQRKGNKGSLYQHCGKLQFNWYMFLDYRTTLIRSKSWLESVNIEMYFHKHLMILNQHPKKVQTHTPNQSVFKVVFFVLSKKMWYPSSVVETFVQNKALKAADSYENHQFTDSDL